jgi:hypothetical protein
VGIRLGGGRGGVGGEPRGGNKDYGGGQEDIAA